MAMISRSATGASDVAVRPQPAAAFSRVAWLRRAVVATFAACATVAVLAVPSVQAQTPAAAPKAKQPPKAAPRQPAAQAQQQPPAQPQQPAQPGAPAAQQMPQFVPSPWVKVCEAQPIKICVTRSLLRAENGAPAALAEFAEPEGQQKLLRITLPLGMMLKFGTRILIDQTQQPYATSDFIACLDGCITVYQVTEDLKEKLKKGKTLYIQAININNAGLNFALPLDTFAKAVDGAPTDPKVYAEQQKKMQEEMQRRQQQQPAAPAPQH